MFGSWVLSGNKCTFALQLSKIDEYIGVGVVDEQYKHREKIMKEIIQIGYATIAMVT